MFADSVNEQLQPRHLTPDYTHAACLQNNSHTELHFITTSLLLNKSNDMDYVWKLKGKMNIIILSSYSAFG